MVRSVESTYNAPYNVGKSVESLAESGVVKARMNFLALFIASIMAGIYISLGFLLSVTCASSFNPNTSFSIFRMVLGAVFPLGLIMVVIGGAELWTGNVQLILYPKLLGKISFRELIYNWILSYNGNFLGSIIAVQLLSYATGLISNPNIMQCINLISKSKLNLTFQEALLRGLGCNILVNVAIWLSARASDTSGKILGIWFPIFAFVTIGFEHSIANMWVIPASIILNGGGVEEWKNFMNSNLLPVTIGNCVGGVIVAFYHWILSQKECVKIAKNIVREIFHITIALTLLLTLSVVFPSILILTFGEHIDIVITLIIYQLIISVLTAKTSLNLSVKL